MPIVGGLKKRLTKWLTARAKKPLGDCEYVRISEKLSVADTFSYFERIRAYIQHEDGLISSRLTWSLTVHGFLFAIYGLMAGKLIDILLSDKLSSVPPLHWAFSALLGVQAIVALFGFGVGFQSRIAIAAAGRALIHIRSIAHESLALGLETKDSSASLECDAVIGPCTVKVCPARGFVDGERVLIDENHESREEYVRVDEGGFGEFKANFKHKHDAGATVRPLGFALLPKVVNGGAREVLFSGAAGYYLTLPAWAMIIWLALFSLSADLAYETITRPEILLISTSILKFY
jgi:hypothetical protein